MEEVDLLRIVRKRGDTKAKSVGQKLFFADPAFYTILNGDVGTSREAMAAMLLSNASYEVEATKDETDGDFVISSSHQEPITLEVGGRNKSPKRSDFVIKDTLDYPGGNALPLWLIGMMY